MYLLLEVYYRKKLRNFSDSVAQLLGMAVGQAVFQTQIRTKYHGLFQ